MYLKTSYWKYQIFLFCLGKHNFLIKQNLPHLEKKNKKKFIISYKLYKRIFTLLLQNDSFYCSNINLFCARINITWVSTKRWSTRNVLPIERITEYLFLETLQYVAVILLKSSRHFSFFFDFSYFGNNVRLSPVTVSHSSFQLSY